MAAGDLRLYSRTCMSGCLEGGIAMISLHKSSSSHQRSASAPTLRPCHTCGEPMEEQRRALVEAVEYEGVPKGNNAPCEGAPSHN